jgi:hypothetical protein
MSKAGARVGLVSILKLYVCLLQTQVQSKRGTRRKTVSDETVPSAAAIQPAGSTTSGSHPGGGGAQDQTGGIHITETEKNTFSTEVSGWIAARKRPPGTTATSRHRSVESTELDLTSINDQLSSHRFTNKEVDLDVKVGASLLRCSLL